MIPHDRANPQAAGMAGLTGRVVASMIRHGLPLAARQRFTYQPLPGPAAHGPGLARSVGYDAALTVASAKPAGPAGFYGRLRGVNR